MAAGSTYTPIATQTLGSSSTNVSFTSIPGTYTDLIIVFDGANITANNSDSFMRFNSDSTTNYSYTVLQGTGAAAQSYRGTSTNAINVGNTNTSIRNNAIIQIMNYANSTTYKTCITRSNNPSNLVQANVGLWRSTAAITQIDLSSEKGASSWASGSTFTLYGIAAA